MTDKNHANKLQLEIEQLRDQMVQHANKNGYTSPESIRLSQELDNLLNEYQRLVQNKELS
ncbi:aspartyl-phosphate phosphatase Spo0E family protein [Filobacillus milosensis]|nr:aspartyl-phosphate phosphatase Spo0E family protein [Filobacillus milosensis]